MRSPESRLADMFLKLASEVGSMFVYQVDDRVISRKIHGFLQQVEKVDGHVAAKLDVFNDMIRASETAPSMHNLCYASHTRNNAWILRNPNNPEEVFGYSPLSAPLPGSRPGEPYRIDLSGARLLTNSMAASEVDSILGAHCAQRCELTFGPLGYGVLKHEQRSLYGPSALSPSSGNPERDLRIYRELQGIFGFVTGDHSPRRLISDSKHPEIHVSTNSGIAFGTKLGDMSQRHQTVVPLLGKDLDPMTVSRLVTPEQAETVATSLRKYGRSEENIDLFLDKCDYVYRNNGIPWDVLKYF